MLSNPLTLLLSLASAVALGFFTTLSFLDELNSQSSAAPVLARIYASGDDHASVFINGKLILQVDGYNHAIPHVPIQKGDEVKIVGINSGGPKGLCLQIVGPDGALLLGMSKDRMDDWRSVDSKTGARRAVVLADNQVYSAHLAKRTGKACNAFWDSSGAGQATLIARVN